MGNMAQAGIGSIIWDGFATAILSFSSPVGLFSINKVEFLGLKNGLWEASSLNQCGLMVEGDSKCTFRWASKCCKLPWNLLMKLKRSKILLERMHSFPA